MTIEDNSRIRPDAIIGEVGQIVWEKRTPFDRLIEAVEGPYGDPERILATGVGPLSESDRALGESFTKLFSYVSGVALAGTAASLALELPAVVTGVSGSLAVFGFYGRSVTAALNRREARGQARNPVASFTSIGSGTVRSSSNNAVIELSTTQAVLENRNYGE